MFPIILYLFLMAVLVALIIKGATEGELKGAIGTGVLLVVMIAAATFILVPFELGYSRIAGKHEPFERRLEAGVIYNVVSIERVAAVESVGTEENIILVRKDLSDDYRAIRAKSVPPKRFTLINGQPVEVK